MANNTPSGRELIKMKEVGLHFILVRFVFYFLFAFLPLFGCIIRHV